MSYFEVFSLPPKLHIDIAALEKQFYAQSRRLHPDRFASKPAAEQEEALNVALVVGGSIVIPHLRRAYAVLAELYGECPAPGA